MRGCAVALIAAAAFVAGGCKFDLEPIRQATVMDCLATEGESPRVFSATGSQVPARYGALLAQEGSKGALAVLGRRRTFGEAWAYLFFFNGTERAEEIHDELVGAGGGRAMIEPAGGRPAASVRVARRQNVLVLFGTSAVYGRAATRDDKRRLDQCFDRAAQEDPS